MKTMSIDNVKKLQERALIVKIKQKFILTIIFSFFLFTQCLSHPHPIISIEASENTIIINPLFAKQIDEAYVRKHFVLENCTYHYVDIEDQVMELIITIKHDCSYLKIKRNTLLDEYWEDIPLIKTVTGFSEENLDLIAASAYDKNKLNNYMEGQLENSDSTNTTANQTINNTKNIVTPKTKTSKSSMSNLGSLPFTFSNNPVILAITLFFVGIFFSLVGDFFSMILPLSLGAQYAEDKKLWLKAGIIHITSTYIFFFLSLRFFATKILRYSGVLILLVGVTMLLESYLGRKSKSPLLVACIPCTATLLVGNVLYATKPFFALFTPLLMGMGDMTVLKVGSSIPFPKKLIKYVPFIIIITGIYLTVKYSLINIGSNGTIPLTFPDNPVLMILNLYVIGIFFTLTGDFFNLVLPISLSTFYTENKKLWLKAGLLHIFVTYFFFIFSLRLYATKLLRYSSLLIILVGISIFVEVYLKKKSKTSIILALIPSTATLAIGNILYLTKPFFAFFTPLFMGLGELTVLKIGSMAPLPKKSIKYVPFIIILSGVYLTVKYSQFIAFP